MFGLFRSAKSLIYHAAVKSRHAEVAFRDASRSMHGTVQALRELHELVDEKAPRRLGKNVYRTMRRVERHAKILRKHTIELRKHMEHIRHTAKQAK